MPRPKKQFDLTTKEGRKQAVEYKKQRENRLLKEKEKGIVDFKNLDDKQPLCIEQVATILGCSTSLIKKLVQKRKIKHEKIGDRIVFRLPYIKEYQKSITIYPITNLTSSIYKSFILNNITKKYRLESIKPIDLSTTKGN